MHAPHARTVALARLLREIKPLRRRRGPVPRQQQPDQIRLEYFKAIRFVADLARSAFGGVYDQILDELRDHRRHTGKLDAAGPGRSPKDRAHRLIDRAADRFAALYSPRELHAVAAKFGERTSDFQRQQLDKQTRAAIGIPFAHLERPIQDHVEEWAAANVALIKTVGDRYFDRLRLDVEDAFTAGVHPETLAKQWAERHDIAIDDARRIARDQIGKLNGQVNQARQQALGVVSYVWRTMRDNRVRDEHYDREGVAFRWDSPPEDGNPGEPIQCRCFAEPDFSEILDSL